MITYDPDADSIYVHLTSDTNAKVERVVVLTDEMMLDYDEAGANRRRDPRGLRRVQP